MSIVGPGSDEERNRADEEAFAGGYRPIAGILRDSYFAATSSGTRKICCVMQVR